VDDESMTLLDLERIDDINLNAVGVYVM
jgi:hypothetical protein